MDLSDSGDITRTNMTQKKNDIMRKKLDIGPDIGYYIFHSFHENTNLLYLDLLFKGMVNRGQEIISRREVNVRIRVPRLNLPAST